MECLATRFGLQGFAWLGSPPSCHEARVKGGGNQFSARARVAFKKERAPVGALNGRRMDLTGYTWIISPWRLMSRPSTSTSRFTRKPTNMSMTFRMIKVPTAQYTNTPATS